MYILLVGDSCIDRYVYGNVKRISPEAPIPVLNIEREERKPGMTLNVESNLKSLGCLVEVITNTKTITKTRFIDSRGYQLLRTDDEPELDVWDMKLPDTSSIDAIGIVTGKQDLARFEGSYVKINRYECDLAKSYNSNLIVTLGKDGAEYNGKIFPTKDIELTDVCGAGDTFLSALCYQFLILNDIEKAIKFANIAASITVQHLGNYAPTLNEILDNSTD